MVLREFGSERAWVVHADDGLDELSTLGPTRVSELKGGHIRTFIVDPSEVNLPYARLSDLQVETPDESAAAILAMVQGQRGEVRDISVLNAAAAMVVAERALDLREGVRLAQSAIDEGAVDGVLQRLVTASNR